MEQRANIMFCYKLGKTANVTREILVQLSESDAVCRKCVSEWSNLFREGNETTEDESCSGR